uniref:H/ACA ribonucleoprotein complex non-core subunit NAF1-like n=1 Tax=Oncorhynchus gorbuscha TaxID=8017 RepID=UPI001EAEC9C1|nr:H/ACA ribonucleoprotein complex non-core subunit NAF1-like [Oncorhynchus gorbuscha]
MEAQPEEMALVPEVLQSSAETHGEELELNNGTSTKHLEDGCTAETEPQGLTSGTSDSRLLGELTGGAEEMEVTENLSSVSSSELGDGTTHLPQDLSRDLSQDLSQDPSQDLSQDPSQDLPQDPSQDLPQDPSQDLSQDPSQDPPQVLLTLQDGVRDQQDSSSSSDSDSDSSSSGVTLAVVLGQADEDDDDDEGFGRARKPCSIKTLDEILPEDLPAVEELTVVLPEEAEILPLGSVTSIIQQLVIIQSLKDTPPLKDDSVIFNSDRLAVGKVFEVFGPVSSPFYVLRFNSESDIAERGVKLKDSMFYAPSLTDYTLYILTEQLRRLKGSDASWKNDQEPPPEALDFSDDEAEQKMKKKKKKGNVQKSERERGQRADQQPDRDSVTRPQMSQRPLQQSRPPRRDNWGPPPRYEGAPYYTHQPHYPYPPPYQPQSFPLYPPPPPPHLSVLCPMTANNSSSNTFITNKMSEAVDTTTLCLFDVDGTLTAARQVSKTNDRSHGTSTDSSYDVPLTGKKHIQGKCILSGNPKCGLKLFRHTVIIQSLKDTPPLKDDSVIFNSDRLAVGKVFEVFGPVSSPFYVLRFNSESDIAERGVKLKDSMFYAPSLTDYTLYILTEQLRRLKGSDASWKNDQEPPPEALDFSDDEAEQKMKKKKKKGNVQKSERERGQRADQQPGQTHTLFLANSKTSG